MATKVRIVIAVEVILPIGDFHAGKGAIPGYSMTNLRRRSDSDGLSPIFRRKTRIRGGIDERVHRELSAHNRDFAQVVRGTNNAELLHSVDQ